MHCHPKLLLTKTFGKILNKSNGSRFCPNPTSRPWMVIGTLSVHILNSHLIPSNALFNMGMCTFCVCVRNSDYQSTHRKNYRSNAHAQTFDQSYAPLPLMPIAPFSIDPDDIKYFEFIPTYQSTFSRPFGLHHALKRMNSLVWPTFILFIINSFK